MISSPSGIRAAALVAATGLSGLSCQVAQEPQPPIRLVDRLQVKTGAEVAPSTVRRMIELPREDDAFGSRPGPGGKVTAVDGLLEVELTQRKALFTVSLAETGTAGFLLDRVRIELKGSSPRGEGVVLEIGWEKEPVDFAELDGRTTKGALPLRWNLEDSEDFAVVDLEPASVLSGSRPPAEVVRLLSFSIEGEPGSRLQIRSIGAAFSRTEPAKVDAWVEHRDFRHVLQESIALRPKKRIDIDVEVAQRPRLMCAVGFEGVRPARFLLQVNPRGGGEVKTLFEQTLSKAQEWFELEVDLEAYSGRPVVLSMTFDSDDDAAVGYWGSPILLADGGGNREKRPRFVLVLLIDTLRQDRLPVYGHDRQTAPRLHDLARSGVVFEDAIAQGVWTKTSVPSFLTSMYPTTLGIADVEDAVAEDVITMAEMFRAGGYLTIGTSAVSFSGTGSNLQQGFDVLLERGSIELPAGSSHSKTARAFVDLLLPWIRARHDAPIFVLLHVLDPHTPYRPYEPWDDHWGDPDRHDDHSKLVDRVRPFIVNDKHRNLGLPRREELEAAGVDVQTFVDTELDWYDGSIRAIDAELDRMIMELRTLGLIDESLIVITSDHGEEFLDHGAHFHERHVYGELANVPLLLWWPSRLDARRVPETVELIDVLPTLAELCDLAAPRRAQGRSMLSLVVGDRGSGSSPGPAVTEWKRQKPQQSSPYVDAVALIDGGWKLIHNTHRPRGQPEFELYDHVNDPLDQVDLAGARPDLVEKLAGRLDEWRRAAQAARVDVLTLEVGHDAQQSLRSLGYLK